MKLSKRQTAVFITIGVAHLCSGMCISVQAPFYPAVASSKGVSPSVFGLVFGVFQLTVFFVSPLCGQYIIRIGSKFMLISGLFITGISCILFGFLDYINDKTTFIVFSFLIRIVEALGNAGYMTASFSIATEEFSDNLSTMISILEIFYGSGLAVGPALGGVLFEAGGYVTPFSVLGSTLLISGITTMFLLPVPENAVSKSIFNVIDLLKMPEILLSMFAVMVATTNVGFIDVTLEPHLRQFGLSPYYIGLMFLLTGLAYAFSTPVWGLLGDKGFHHRYMVILGGLITITSFILIGPAPFLMLNPSILLISIALVIQGIGFGAEMIASFTGGQKDAVELGLPNELSTFGLVSGLWTSSFALGAFFGPSCAGVLLDVYGFRNSTMFIVGFNGLLIFSHMLFITLKRANRKETSLEIAKGVISETIEDSHIGRSLSSTDCNVYESCRKKEFTEERNGEK